VTYFCPSPAGKARSTCRRVSCDVAGHGHPHLPKGHIFGKNGVLIADALLPDQSLQLDMFLLPVGSTMNTDDSPSTRQISSRGTLSAIEDCCGFFEGVDRANVVARFPTPNDVTHQVICQGSVRLPSLGMKPIATITVPCSCWNFKLNG
jgi:hypothetical protein